MFCKNCGNNIAEHQRFCSKCGTTNDYFNPNATPTVAKPMLTAKTGLLGAYGISNKVLFMAGQVVLFLLQLIFWFCETMQITVSYDGEKESAGLSLKEWAIDESVDLNMPIITTISVFVLVVLMVLATVRLIKPILAAYVPAVNKLPINGITALVTIVFEIWYLFWNGLYIIYMFMTADDLSSSMIKVSASPTFTGVLAFLTFFGVFATLLMIGIENRKEKKVRMTAQQF